jgi:molecular chaperone GrpE
MSGEKPVSEDVAQAPASDEQVAAGTGAEESPEAGAGSSQPDTEARVAELTQALSEAQAKAAENWDQVLRARAEMENVQRRLQREVENAHKFGLEKFALELLPVKDSLEMGLTAAQHTEAEKLREGMELTLRMLTTAMGKFGIETIDPDGEAFNPDFHQAMATQESSQAKPDTVLTVMQKGYQLNDRLLRPALVIVAKPPAQDVPKVDEKA